MTDPLSPSCFMENVRHALPSNRCFFYQDRTFLVKALRIMRAKAVLEGRQEPCFQSAPSTFNEGIHIRHIRYQVLLGPGI